MAAQQQAAFDIGQMALIEKVARTTAEEILRLYRASLHADAVSAARGVVAEHARACLVRVELWKLVIMAFAGGVTGGGIIKLLGG